MGTNDRPLDPRSRDDMQRLFVERRAEAQQLLDRVFTRVNALDPSIVEWSDVDDMGRIVRALRSVAGDELKDLENL